MRWGTQYLCNISPSLLRNATTVNYKRSQCKRCISTKREEYENYDRKDTKSEGVSFRDLQHLVNTQNLQQQIIQHLKSSNPYLDVSAAHLFRGGGKYFRPTCVMLMGASCNAAGAPSNTSLQNQRQIALISEMIHVASLVHDDVLDEASRRRNLHTVNHLYNDKVAMLTGDFIIARATELLSKINCSKTIQILSSVIRDLVKGEIMQLNSAMSSDILFENYINKTYLKTASLLAHSCQAVALHSPLSQYQHKAFEYGKNVGIAFQLIDDMLDVVATSNDMGKSTGADMELGLATAPVLYASLKHPQLLDLIERRFSRSGDTDLALQYIHDSEGISHTKGLATKYCKNAVKQLDCIPDSPYKDGLVSVCNIVLNRST